MVHQFVEMIANMHSVSNHALKGFFLAGIRVFIQKINSFQVFFANLGSRFTPLSASKKSGHRGRIVQLEAFEDRCLVAFLLDVTCISAVLLGANS